MAGKQDERDRRALAKAVAVQLRQQAKGTGWKVSLGWLFREDEGWFVEARGAVWISEHKSTLEIRMKPMGIDPIFWEIVLAPDNIHEPLSLRMLGAWTCSVPALTELSVDEADGDATALARAILAHASDELLRSRQHRSLTAFIEYLEGQPRRVDCRPYLASIVCAKVFAGDGDGARTLCLEARAALVSDGFQVGSKRFVDLALEWLDARHPTLH